MNKEFIPYEQALELHSADDYQAENCFRHGTNHPTNCYLHIVGVILLLQFN